MLPRFSRTGRQVPLRKAIEHLKRQFQPDLIEKFLTLANRTQQPADVHLLDVPGELAPYEIGRLKIPPKAMEPTIQGLLNLLNLAHGDPHNPFKFLDHEWVDQSLVNRLTHLMMHSIMPGHGALEAKGFGGHLLGVGTFGDRTSPRPHWEETQALPSSDGRPACHADMSVPPGWAAQGVMRAMAEQLLRSAWQEGHGTLIFDLDPGNKAAAKVLAEEFGAVPLRPARAEGMPPTSWWAAPTIPPPPHLAVARALAAETHPGPHFSKVLKHKVSAKPRSASAKQAPTKRLPAPM